MDIYYLCFSRTTFFNKLYKPQSFKKDMKDISKLKWEKIMKNKYLFLIYNKTWTLVIKPQNHQVFWRKWAYKLKKKPNNKII